MPPSDPGTPCVYILASKRNGTLYVGVTANLRRRARRHKSDVGSDFTQEYGSSQSDAPQFLQRVLTGAPGRTLRRSGWLMRLSEATGSATVPTLP